MVSNSELLVTYSLISSSARYGHSGNSGSGEKPFSFVYCFLCPLLAAHTLTLFTTSCPSKVLPKYLGVGLSPEPSRTFFVIFFSHLCQVLVTDWRGATPAQIPLLKPNCQCVVFGDGAFGWSLGVDEVMRLGPCSFKKRPQRAPSPTLHCAHRRKQLLKSQEERPQNKTRFAGILILDFQKEASRIGGNKLLLFKPPRWWYFVTAAPGD